MGGLGKGGEFEELVDAALERRPAHSTEFAVEFQGFSATQMFVKIGVFREIADVVTGIGFERIFPKNMATAAGGGEQAEKGLHGGRFSGTIGTDQTIDCSLRDGEGDVVDCSVRASPKGTFEVLNETLNNDRVLTHC